MAPARAHSLDVLRLGVLETTLVMLGSLLMLGCRGGSAGADADGAKQEVATPSEGKVDAVAKAPAVTVAKDEGTKAPTAGGEPTEVEAKTSDPANEGKGTAAAGEAATAAGEGVAAAGEGAADEAAAVAGEGAAADEAAAAADEAAAAADGTVNAPVGTTPAEAEGLCNELEDPTTILGCTFAPGGKELPGGGRLDVLELGFRDYDGEATHAYAVLRVPGEYPQTKRMVEEKDIPGQSSAYELKAIELKGNVATFRAKETVTTYPNTGEPDEPSGEYDEVFDVVVRCSISDVECERK